MQESLHKELLSDLIRRLETEELPWYDQQADKNLFWWRAFGVASLVLAALTTGVAALIKADAFGTYRPVLVVLPILGSLVSGCAQIFRFRETEALRASGRIDDQVEFDVRGVAKSESVEGEVRAAKQGMRPATVIDVDEFAMQQP